MSFYSFDVWMVVAWSLAAMWTVILGAFLISCRGPAKLRQLGDRKGSADQVRLSVIVAARNEECCIENCLRSLLRQDHPNFEVIAVNDRSTDQTAQILERLATEFAGQLKVIHVTTLAHGWFGKPHALNLAMQSATGEALLFTDADCEYQSPSALRTTVDDLYRRNLDFLSVAARYTMDSLRERVLVPCCSEALLTWLRPERIEDPEWPEAFANGAFILVRRASFEQIGGWGAVRSKISEDLELARLTKRSGQKIGIAYGDDFYETGSYATRRDSWNGWCRILKGVLSPSRLSITLARMSVLFLLPFVMTVWGVWHSVSTGSIDWFLGGPGLGFAIAFGCRCVLDAIMFRLVGSSVWVIPFAPLGRLFVMAASIKALCSHAGWVNTHWRGAMFSAGQLVMPRHVKPKTQIQ